MTSSEPTKVGSFLTFIEEERNGKTKYFQVNSSHEGSMLGYIYWRSGWRRYVMHFDASCDWSIECMAECYKFIQKLMDERKKTKTEDGIPPKDKSLGILPTNL